MDEMREKIRQDAMAETQRASKKKDDEEITDDWTAEQSQLLIKAVNLFPAGTASRYNCCLLLLRIRSAHPQILGFPIANGY